MTLVLDGTPYANHGILIVETQGNDLAHSWRNTIDVVWSTGGQPAYGDPVVSAFVTFLQNSQRDDCHITKVSLYPYVKGRQPLSSQGALWEQDVDLPCADYGTGHVYPAEVASGLAPIGEICVRLIKGKFAGGGGRVGRMFIRNAIANAWVVADAGGPPAPNPTVSPAIGTQWNTYATSKLGSYCTDNPLPRFCLVHAQKLTQTPPAHDIFDSAMQVPAWEGLTTHNLTKKSKK